MDRPDHTPSMNARPRAELLRTLSILRRGLMVLCSMLLLAPFVASVLWGARILVVEGGSMAPTFAVGDLIILAPPANGTLVPGTIVTVRRDDSTLYTHRIIDVNGTWLTTQGDANPVPDTREVTPADIVGTVSAHIGAPWSGLLQATQTLLGRVVLAAFLAALILFPNLVRCTRPSRDRRT
ncbi:signal peptidase I [Microbacterium sp. NPDC077663]|uniref:signal peptidase I n=1 Tax=Microbacterium sp. NPDC077663 TaxID=3364189 RepID=UPI0037CAD9DA